MNKVRLPIYERFTDEDGVEKCVRLDTGETISADRLVEFQKFNVFALFPTRDGTVQMDHSLGKVLKAQGVLMNRQEWRYSPEHSLRRASFCYVR